MIPKGDRFSIIKRGFYAKITLVEFVKFVKQFCEAFELACKKSVIDIELYNGIPTYNTAICEEISAGYDRANENMKTVTLHNLKDLTTNFFNAATYIRVIIKPENSKDAPSCAFGSIECKGKLPRTIVFYAQPEIVANTISEKFPTNTKFLHRYVIGNGFEKISNHVTEFFNRA